LDINGKMRMADRWKRKGRPLLLKILPSRRIDPGSWKKWTENLSYPIYPIKILKGPVPSGIVMNRKLVWEHQATCVHLPLAFTNPIESFRHQYHVIGVGTHRVSIGRRMNNCSLANGKTRDASHQWNHFQADKSIRNIRIPQALAQGHSDAAVGNHYFLCRECFPGAKENRKPAPHHITLLWDASLSGTANATVRKSSICWTPIFR